MNSYVASSTFYQNLIDEQFFPEILNYDWNSVAFFKEILIYQYDLVHKTKILAEFDIFSKFIKELEISRILNILKCYHRTRIWKIENFLSIKINLKKFTPRLNKSEEYFIISFRNLLLTHQSFLVDDFNNKMLGTIRKINNINREDNTFIKKENFLFFRLFKKNVFKQPFSFENLYKIELAKNLTFCMKFHSIRYLILSKALYLV